MMFYGTYTALVTPFCSDGSVDYGCLKEIIDRQADAVACELEHVVPPHVIRRWGQFVLYLRTKDFWKNWQSEYQSERKKLISTMEKTFQNMGSLDNQEEVQELARKYR